MRFLSRSGHAAFRFRPTLERLEDRDCLSTITLSVAQAGNRYVYLSGQVSNPNPGAGTVVEISGACNLSVTTNASGAYAVVAQASGLGTIQAALNDDGATTPAQAAVPDQAPTIGNFQVVNHGNNIYTFSGTVGAQYAPGMTVTFSGLADMQGRTTTVNSDGTFSLTVTLNAADCGTVGATVTDWYGLMSTTVYVYVAVS